MLRLVPLFLAATVVALIGQSPALHADEDKYRVGDRLQNPAAKSAGGISYQNVTWEALIPEGWDPAQAFRGINLGMLDDSDKRARDALARLRKAWDEAPVERAWNGKRIRIPGFVVPLERQNDEVTEFLLVPYFGACIHTPPPPANQIIHVSPAKPVKQLRSMAAVWVSGVLETSRAEALKGGAENILGMGVAGYRMKAEQIEPYKEQR